MLGFFSISISTKNLTFHLSAKFKCIRRQMHGKTRICLVYVVLAILPSSRRSCRAYNCSFIQFVKWSMYKRSRPLFVGRRKFARIFYSFIHLNLIRKRYTHHGNYTGRRLSSTMQPEASYIMKPVSGIIKPFSRKDCFACSQDSIQE